MKNQKKLENAFKKFEHINYNNPHGGAYAYLQFMAYSREVLQILRPIKQAEKHSENIEAMSWLFNEYLTMNFTHRHKALFEDKMSEIKLIFESIRATDYENEVVIKTGFAAHLMGNCISKRLNAIYFSLQSTKPYILCLQLNGA